MLENSKDLSSLQAFIHSVYYCLVYICLAHLILMEQLRPLLTAEFSILTSFSLIHVLHVFVVYTINLSLSYIFFILVIFKKVLRQ